MIHPITHTHTTTYKTGKTPENIFGGIDACKFWETTTLFAVVAHAKHEQAVFQVFAGVLSTFSMDKNPKGTLHKKTMDCIVNKYHWTQYSGVTTVDKLALVNASIPSNTLR